MKRCLLLLIMTVFYTGLNAQTISPEKDSLQGAPKNQIGITTGLSGYQLSFMATYKRAHAKSSIGTLAGVNMGYWYYGFMHSKDFRDASRSDLEMISSLDSVSVYRANSEFQRYYGIQFGRSREVRSCDRRSFSGFQFSFDYYAFMNYGIRSYRYQEEYLMFEVPASTQYMEANNLPNTPVNGERQVTSLNAGLGMSLGLDMVFGMGNGRKNNTRNVIVGLKYGVPNIGVDIPIGEKSITDPSNVFVEVADQSSLTFYQQVLFKVGIAF